MCSGTRREICAPMKEPQIAATTAGAASFKLMSFAFAKRRTGKAGNKG